MHARTHIHTYIHTYMHATHAPHCSSATLLNLTNGAQDMPYLQTVKIYNINNKLNNIYYFQGNIAFLSLACPCNTPTICITNKLANLTARFLQIFIYNNVN